MGAWNYQILCDDTACDAMCDLMDSEDFVEDIGIFFDEALDQGEDYLDFDAGQYALLAAAVVDAAVHGVDWTLLLEDGSGEDAEYSDFFAKAARRKADLEPLCKTAKEVVSLVLGKDSELRELWEENETLYPKWKKNVERLGKRLGK